jgi:hypothetical protein
VLHAKHRFDVFGYILKKGSRKGLRKSRREFYRRQAQSKWARKRNAAKKEEKPAAAAKK